MQRRWAMPSLNITFDDGLYLAVLYYLGLRRGEALGLQWGDLDFDEDLVHVQRDIDFCGSTARDGDLKTDAADRYVPIPGELRAMLTKMRGFPQQYVFHTEPASLGRRVASSASGSA